jgi:putative AlgH/UPF0301 family transcriptional regulator
VIRPAGSTGVPTGREDDVAAALAGQLLIASPDMRDPRFDHAVILVVEHDRDGAFGIVINKPAGERPLAADAGSVRERMASGE